MRTILATIAAVTLASASAWAGKCVDINRGDAAQLDRLYRVGAKTASKIIEARKTGRFASLDDVAKRVSGIGPKTVAEWRKGDPKPCKLK